MSMTGWISSVSQLTSIALPSTSVALAEKTPENDILICASSCMRTCGALPSSARSRA